MSESEKLFFPQLLYTIRQLKNFWFIDKFHFCFFQLHLMTMTMSMTATINYYHYHQTLLCEPCGETVWTNVTSSTTSYGMIWFVIILSASTFKSHCWIFSFCTLQLNNWRFLCFICICCYLPCAFLPFWMKNFKKFHHK